MPWTIEDVDEHKQGLTDAQKRRWVEIANSVRRQCLQRGNSENYCDALAIRQANGAVNQNNMEYININNHYQIRHAQHQGRRHIIVPVVMMREGVHCGSHGPMYHSAEELGKYPASWDGIPVMINHPTDDNGQGISANNPDVIDREIVGRVYNTHMEDDKLKGEAWLDEQRLIAVSPTAYEYIQQGKPIDVSVGVFTDELEQTGEYNGERYESVARNPRPDHLAVLPDGEGACSWTDGCGIRNNENKKGGAKLKRRTKKVQTLAATSARVPMYQGTSTKEWQIPTLEEYIIGYRKHHPKEEVPEMQDVSELNDNMRQWITSLTLKGDPKAKTFDKLTLQAVTDPDTLELNENALHDIIEQKVNTNSADDGRVKAFQLLSDEFGLNIPNEFSRKQLSSAGFAVNPMTNRTGYTRLAQVIQRKLDTMDSGNRVHYLDELFENEFVYRVEMHEDASTEYYRQPYNVPEEGDVEFTGDPERVQKEVNYVNFKNEGGNIMSTNEKCCPDKVDQLIAHELSNYTEDDKEWLLEQNEETIDKMFPKNPEPPKEPNTNELKGEDLAKALKNYAKKPEDFIGLAPDELQESLRSGLTLHKQERQRMVKEIIDNTAEGTWGEDELKAMPTETLQKLSKSVVKHDYSGMGPTPEPTPQMNEADVLPMPGADFKEENEK